ncbi:unnamed protein product [Pleuronectes platessa]|uniref:Uncharacterized protein n=1 Tax=Pleuronectes platessa TaxID=8262 RepID=A0A9N7VKC2_PLEPL|nr:unnamed protein product [Pleuronectes platessa]
MAEHGRSCVYRRQLQCLCGLSTWLLKRDQQPQGQSASHHHQPCVWLTHDISLDEFEDDDLSEITEITDECGLSLNCNGPDMKSGDLISELIIIPGGGFGMDLVSSIMEGPTEGASHTADGRGVSLCRGGGMGGVAVLTLFIDMSARTSFI